MNANELASDIENGMFNDVNYNKKKAAEFIRQQQAEIEALKNPILRAISMAFDPLTDEEIKQVYLDLFGFNLEPFDNRLKFARAILRKAQEK